MIDNPLMAGVKIGYTLDLNADWSLRPFAGGELVKHSHPTYELENFWEYEAGLGAWITPAVREAYGATQPATREVDLGEVFRRWTGVERNFATTRGGCLYLGYLGQFGQEGYAVPRGLNAKFTLLNDGSDNGFLPKVGLAAIAVANNIISQETPFQWGLGLFVNTIRWESILPFFYGDLWMGDYLDPADNLLQLNLGVELNIINNALLSCRYSTGNLLTTYPGEMLWGELVTELKVTYK